MTARKPSPAAATGTPTSIAVLASGCDLGSGLEAGLGVPPSGSGLRPSGGAAKASPAEPLVPNAALIALAERCEAATGPDRELDLVIYRTSFLARNPDCVAFGVNHTDYPAHTASLDAAMTLADGYGGSFTFFKDGTAKAFLWQPYPLAVEAKAATLALAICASALRAKAGQ